MGVVLGIWDGHDAGAALLKGDQIVCAVNEERLSRRKLEVGFPRRAIRACLAYGRTQCGEVQTVALSTTDPAKTLTRLMPGLKEQYYLLRRRKAGPKPLDGLRKAFKYRFTELAPNGLSRSLTRRYAVAQLNRLGFSRYKLHILDHHRCHAAGAARFSGYQQALIVTLDGVGDGCSGSVWDFDDGRLRQIQRFPASPSLGIFFEHVTRLMNMRELEDEGKVMALANYAYPVPDAENPLMALLKVRDLEMVSPYSSTAMFRRLKRILWRYPSEQFAYMAQRFLERRVAELVQQAASRSPHRHLGLAGGIFSNIKLNMKIEAMPRWKRVFVFPHMGDGGLAMGAAMEANQRQHGVSRYPRQAIYLGPEFSTDGIKRELNQWGFPYRKLGDKARRAADMLMEGEIILWFQGRMEWGPRALGNRSILARPDRPDIRDRLNLMLKKRVWYQPFCPSILREDAPSILHVENRSLNDNPFMTTACRVRADQLALMAGVINIDGTCRPHVVGDENVLFRDVLLGVKKRLGMGVVLNTSLNVHGDPMVCSPADALDLFARVDAGALFLGDFLVEKRE